MVTSKDLGFSNLEMSWKDWWICDHLLISLIFFVNKIILISHYPTSSWHSPLIQVQSPVVATPVQPLLPGQSPQGTPTTLVKGCCTVMGKEKHGTQKRTTTLNWKRGADSKCLPFLWHVLCWLEILDSCLMRLSNRGGRVKIGLSGMSLRSLSLDCWLLRASHLFR